MRFWWIVHSAFTCYADFTLSELKLTRTQSCANPHVNRFFWRIPWSRDKKWKEAPQCTCVDSSPSKASDLAVNWFYVSCPPSKHEMCKCDWQVWVCLSENFTMPVVLPRNKWKSNMHGLCFCDAFQTNVKHMSLKSCWWATWTWTLHRLCSPGKWSFWFLL